jgi:hypothetical protein
MLTSLSVEVWRRFAMWHRRRWLDLVLHLLYGTSQGCSRLQLASMNNIISSTITCAVHALSLGRLQHSME